MIAGQNMQRFRQLARPQTTVAKPARPASTYTPGTTDAPQGMSASGVPTPAPMAPPPATGGLSGGLAPAAGGASLVAGAPQQGARSALAQGRQARTTGQPPLPPMGAGAGARSTRQGVQQMRNAQPTVTPPADPQDGSLQGAAFLPGQDPRLQNAQGATDSAAAAVQAGDQFSTLAQGAEGRYRNVFGTGNVARQGVNPDVQFNGVQTQVAGGPAVDAADGGKYMAEQDAALAGLGGPNRTELAKARLADFDAQDAENRQNRYRSLTQNAAGAGRLGMMDEARKVLDSERLFNQDRMRFSNELASNVAEGDINDRFRRVDATSGLRNQEFGIGSNVRGERRTERDYTTGLDERNVARRGAERDTALAAGERQIGRRMAERDANVGLTERNADRSFDRSRSAVDFGGRDASADLGDRYDRLTASASLEDRIFGQGQSNRDEYRGERGYQDAQRQRGIDNRVRQQQLEEDSLDARMRRALMQSQAGGY